MATLYSDIYNVFLEKISDTNLLSFTETNREALMHGYMIRSCNKFKRICNKDLTDRNETIKQFNVNLADDDIDIITTGMVVEWLRPQYQFNENLQNVLNTKDYNLYSPANLLKELRETFVDTRNEFEGMMNKYSYIHGKVEDLKNG